MSSFSIRARQHDEQALQLVIAIFQAAGFSNFVLGTESDSPELREALRQQHDRTSIMLRYRPDQLFIRPGARTVLCEVKSEAKGYPNFAIEADAYRAALEWNAAYRHCLYAFCDLSMGKQYGCWADDIPRPRRITVPGWRPDAAETVRRLRANFPDTAIETQEWRAGGSGTAYFLLPKPLAGRPTCLHSLPLFVQQQVCAAVAHMPHLGEMAVPEVWPDPTPARPATVQVAPALQQALWDLSDWPWALGEPNHGTNQR